ncbi:hypothetical protein [Paenibacillus gansuensis]|uniref:Uncharacterized protein n=1 Tax=Paenibacillus gansuensis TaxID=306542 RepID=A0ABW5PBN7_9BACL
MEKRLSRTEYLFSLFFILMLVGAVGAFFYGVQIGTQKAEAKYSGLLSPVSKQPTAASYPQQQLVSFYHTIFSPYRVFQGKWFDHLDAMDRQQTSASPSSLLNELSRIADEEYRKAAKSSMPGSTPLLQEAQKNYLKSLKLFSQSAAKYKEKAEGLGTAAFIRQITADPYVQEAANFGLLAQAQYYEAILKWNAGGDSNLKLASMPGTEKIDLKQWSGLSLNSKNAYLANLLLEEKQYEPFDPQDLSVRIDQMLRNGTLQKLKLTNVREIALMLIETEAVRAGDYLKNRDKYYANEKLPLIPLLVR